MKDFNTLVTERLEIEADKITDDLTPKDVPRWDSMNFLLLIADLENEYGVSFSMDEVMGAQSLGDVRKILQSKGIQV